MSHETVTVVSENTYVKGSESSHVINSGTTTTTAPITTTHAVHEQTHVVTQQPVTQQTVTTTSVPVVAARPLESMNAKHQETDLMMTNKGEIKEKQKGGHLNLGTKGQ